MSTIADGLRDAGLVPCALCGRMTPKGGTRRCDRCWELESRIEDDPNLAMDILYRVLRGNPKP